MKEFKSKQLSATQNVCKTAIPKGKRKYTATVFLINPFTNSGLFHPCLLKEFKSKQLSATQNVCKTAIPKGKRKYTATVFLINPFTNSGLFHPCLLEDFIFHSKCTCCNYCYFAEEFLYANSVEPHKTSSSTDSHLNIHCLPRSPGDAWDKWASAWDYGTYDIGDQRKLMWTCASAQSHQSLRVRIHEVRK